VTPLTGSLNPVNYMTALRTVLQVHLAGENDDEVPAKIARSFFDALDRGETSGVAQTSKPRAA